MVHSRYPPNDELYSARVYTYILVSTHKYGKNKKHICTYHKYMYKIINIYSLLSVSQEVTHL